MKKVLGLLAVLVMFVTTVQAETLAEAAARLKAAKKGTLHGGSGGKVVVAGVNYGPETVEQAVARREREIVSRATSTPTLERSASEIYAAQKPEARSGYERYARPEGMDWTKFNDDWDNWKPGKPVYYDPNGVADCIKRGLCSAPH